MKKIVIIILTVITASFVLAFAGCDTETSLQVYVPDGAPALAVANIISEGKAGGVKAKVTISTGEDVVAKCGSGQADIAIVPTNAAVKVCSARDDYQLFTTNVWGLLYVVGWRDVSSLTELNGKTVASIGMGNTGEYLFKRILDVNGVSYADASGVKLNYVDDGTVAIGVLIQNKCDFALLGEPAATNAISRAATQGKTLYRVFDLQALWQDVTESDKTGYPQASVIVKKSLLVQNGFADALYETLTANAAFLSANASKLNGLLVSAGSLLNVNYTADIISRCNIRAVKANGIKQEIFDYLSEFGEQFTNLLKDGIYYDFDGEKAS